MIPMGSLTDTNASGGGRYWGRTKAERDLGTTGKLAEYPVVQRISPVVVWVVLGCLTDTLTDTERYHVAVQGGIDSISDLVEAASLVFLTSFAAANTMALVERVGKRWVAATALAVGSRVEVVFVSRLVTKRPIAHTVLVAIMVASFVVPPWIPRHVETD